MRVYPLRPIHLFIKNGVYVEKIFLPETNSDVNMVGESADSTIIRFADHAQPGYLTTFQTYTAKISGNRFYAQDISFENTAGPVGQAVALHVDADKVVFRNCRFLGNQDCIFVGGENSRQLFVNCYIEGTTDFIFGPATAFFDSCTIRCKADSYISAASTTRGKKYGLIFRNCKIETDANLSRVYLGRPWRADAKTIYIQCTLPRAIVPAGWDNWGNRDNETTVYFAEIANIGPGAATAKRVGWSRQLGSRMSAKYSRAKVFSGFNFMAADSDWYRTGRIKFNWPSKK